MSSTLQDVTIPVIDISKLDGNPQEVAELVSEVRFAAHNVGFFYIKGHSIPKSVTDNILKKARNSLIMKSGKNLKLII